MTELVCSEYSEKSIVVHGDTRLYKEELKKLGGKYNANLRNGPGWIFSKNAQDKVEEFINSKEKFVDNSNHTFFQLEKMIENALRNASLKQRLDFVATVANLANRPDTIVVLKKIEEEEE